jgi:hypothetical protein
MRRYFELSLVLLGLLTACGGAATPEPDRIATDVAEAQAVAATLTAAAPTIAPPLPTAVPTLAPAATAPRPPTPTNTPIPQRADPFVPGGGEPKGLIGKITLPGYDGSAEQVDLPVFNEQIVFQLLVYDPDFGTQDGAGINSVEMTVFDPNGGVVQTRTEQNAPYCSFGNDQPQCPAWVFAEHDYRWPNGTPVCRGQGYQALMVVKAQNGSKTDAMWRFNFDIDGNYPPC